jgi:hypothetical protein
MNTVGISGMTNRAGSLTLLHAIKTEFPRLRKGSLITVLKDVSDHSDEKLRSKRIRPSVRLAVAIIRLLLPQKFGDPGSLRVAQVL